LRKNSTKNIAGDKKVVRQRVQGGSEIRGIDLFTGEDLSEKGVRHRKGKINYISQ